MPAPDLVLAIETSNPTAHAGAAGVALGRPTAHGMVILREESLSPQTRLDDDLVPAIDRLFRAVGASPADLGGVAVSIGPGGYTSVRIGVSAAKLIARARGARVFSVPTAMVAAIAASRECPAGTSVAVCLAWKRDEVWLHRFRAGDPPVPLDDGRVAPVSTIDAADTVVMDTQGAERLGAIGAVAPSRPAIGLRVSASDVLRACVRIEPVLVEALLPLYPREPEAVTKWRERGKAAHG